MTDYSDKRLDDKFSNVEKALEHCASEVASLRRLLLGFLISLSITLIGAVAAAVRVGA